MNKRILWKKIKQRGPILWSNTDCGSRMAGYSGEYDKDGNFIIDKSFGWFPATYFIRSYPGSQLNPYESLSALRPCGSKKNPHEFEALIYDEDEGAYDDWEVSEVRHPLKWQTEREFLEAKHAKDI
ncbi:hypothetical protein [Lactiplantibacillus pingfangensis]|uniref:hypothetical protein n=1 Tax=Lactiplantibacillus pingfangensis TaxID=2559915 RepID=UPI0010F742D2|nr:hypothetical protein [Lactiplantibacillus pingfangensis]